MAFIDTITEYKSSQDSGEGLPYTDIMNFIYSPQYCGFPRLFPVQKFLIKLIYGVPLDENLEDPIILMDQFNEVEIRRFRSEPDFLSFLYDTGRINCKEFNYPLTRVYMVLGRRGTKTTISSIVAAHTMHMVLSFDDPYGYFGVLPISEIGVGVTSNNDENAARQSREIASIVYSNPFFKPYLVQKDPPISGFSLRTKQAVRENRWDLPKVSVQVKAASPAVRGGNFIVAIADEFAHYIDSNASTRVKPLDKYISESLTPSISGFKNQETGDPLGRAIFITSPNGKKGLTWKYKNDLAKDNPDILFINMPSWWSNPNLSSVELRNAWKESERSFQQEYGAEFVEQESTFITEESVVARMVNPELKNTLENSNPKRYYFASLDLALSSDNAAISVCHYEPIYEERATIKGQYDNIVAKKSVFVFDYVWMISPDKEEGNDISVDAVIDQMFLVGSYYKIQMWSWDQWSEAMFRQWLAKRNFNCPYETVSATPTWNSDASRLFKTLMVESRLVIPDDMGIYNEILGLKEKISSHLIKVENDTGHDDRYSAMAKSLWMCYQSQSKTSDPSVVQKSVARTIISHNKKVLAVRNKRDIRYTTKMLR